MAYHQIRSIIRDIRPLMQGNYRLVTLGVTWIMFWRGLFNPYMGIYFKEAFGGTYLLLGVLLAIGQLSLALVSIPGGYFCDYYGRRKMMVIGGHITTLASFITALALDWQGFFIGHVFFFLSIFWAPTAEQAILMDSIPPEKRGLGFALNSAIMGLVGMISPYVGGWVYTNYGTVGMRAILFAIAIAQLIKGIVNTLFLKESLTIHPRKQEKTNLVIALKQIVQSFKSIRETLKLMPKSLLGFCVTSLLFSLGASLTGTQLLISGQQLLGTFFVLYATVDVISLYKIQWGFINTIMGVISMALMIPSGKLVDKYGRRIFIIFFLGATSILIPAFIFCRTYHQVMAVMVVSGIVGTLATPAWRAIPADYTLPEMRGKVQAVLQMLNSISAFSGSMVGGYLYGLNFKFPFWIYAFFSFLATIVAFLKIKVAKNLNNSR